MMMPKVPGDLDIVFLDGPWILAVVVVHGAAVELPLVLVQLERDDRSFSPVLARHALGGQEQI